MIFKELRYELKLYLGFGARYANNLQEATNSKIVADFETITLQQEQFIQCILNYVKTSIESILNKFK